MCILPYFFLKKWLRGSGKIVKDLDPLGDALMPLRTVTYMFLCLLFATSEATASNLNYYDFLSKYLKSDFSMMSAQMDYQASISDSLSSRGLFFPQLRGDLSVGQTTDELVSNKKYYNYSASLEQGIFSYKNIARYKTSRLIRQAGKVIYGEKVAQRILKVTTALLNYKLSLRLQKLRYADQRNTRSSLLRTQKRYRAGDISKTEVWPFESRVFTSTARWEQAKNQTAKKLRKVLALGIKQSEVDLFIPKIPTSESTDVTKNGAVKLASSKVEIARGAEREAFATMLPELDLKVKASRERPFDSNYAAEYDRSISLNLTIPIFSGGTDFYKRKSEVSRRISSQYLYRSLLIQTTNQIDDIRVEIKRVKKIKALFQSSHFAAKKNLRGVTSEFRSGTKNSIDVLSVRKNLIEAQIGRINAEFKEMSLKLVLLYKTGELTLPKIKRWGRGSI